MGVIQHKITWWCQFLFATFALSKVFEETRQVTSESATANPLMLLFWVLVLVFSFIFLGYEAYIKSISEGKLAHKVWLFEKMRQFQFREGHK